ncbi:hypothetical protein CGLO_13159 [Colletotrichum gloeosporioides Cg-14]
MHNVS